MWARGWRRGGGQQATKVNLVSDGNKSSLNQAVGFFVFFCRCQGLAGNVKLLRLKQTIMHFKATKLNTH